MGPAATADFYLKLIQAAPAAVDQEHLQVLIWSDPSIPDRTDALLTHGADPTPALIAGAKMLRQSGARMLAVPCNTAHAFLAAVQTEVDIPIIHMIEETANYVHQLKPAIRRVGLLSTTGTQKAGLYHAWLDQKGIQVLSRPVSATCCRGSGSRPDGRGADDSGRTCPHPRKTRGNPSCACPTERHPRGALTDEPGIPFRHI